MSTLKTSPNLDCWIGRIAQNNLIKKGKIDQKRKNLSKNNDILMCGLSKCG
jgi:hypothetical protein